MKDWWNALERREQRVLAIGIAVLLLVVFWIAVWEPLSDAREQRQLRVDAARQTLAFMEHAVPEIQRLRQLDGAVRNPAQRGRQSLLGLTDASAREAGLGGVLGRVEPAGEGRVRLWFEGAPFDALIDWADKLSVEQGIKVPEFSADRSVGTGRVNARLLLEESAQP